VQSPSWDANWFATSEEIPRISLNLKVHYRTHKRPSPVSILGQPNPIHIPTCHFLEIRPNIIHPSTPRSPQCYINDTTSNILWIEYSFYRVSVKIFLWCAWLYLTSHIQQISHIPSRPPLRYLPFFEYLFLKYFQFNAVKAWNGNRTAANWICWRLICALICVGNKR